MNDTCSKCGAPVDMGIQADWLDANGDPRCPNGGTHEVHNEVEQPSEALLAAVAEIRDETGHGDETLLGSVPERVLQDDKPRLELDSTQQVWVSNWHQFFAGTALTPVAEHDTLEATGNDPTVRDYITTELVIGWLGVEIDGVTPGPTNRQHSMALEEMLGRCRANTPEKATCEALLFTARLGERMASIGYTSGDFMTALAEMPDDDIKMLVEAGAQATSEMTTYINVLVQSVAVTKVTR